jgi:hypothetical protein
MAIRSRWTAERRFHVGISIALLATVFVGFARSFYLRPLFPSWPSPAEPVFYLHGVAFTAWFVLLVAQSYLIGARQLSIHRTIGYAAIPLGLAMLVLGYTASITAASRPTGFVGIPVPALQFLIIPFVDLFTFGTFIALGVLNRRASQAHKRWMLLASIAMLPAAVARWPGLIGGSPVAFFGLADLFLVAMVAWDLRSSGRIHRVTLWGGLALVISQPLRLAMSSSPAWLTVAHWLTGVPAS